MLMPTSTVVLTVLEDGSTGGKEILTPLKMGEQKWNMSELFVAVYDCSADFFAQLFAPEAFMSSPKRFPSAARAVPAP